MQARWTRSLTLIAAVVVGGSVLSLLPAQKSQGGTVFNNTTIPLCLNNCSGHGTCVSTCPKPPCMIQICKIGQPCPPTEFCVCDPLYTGPDCGLSQEIKCYEAKETGPDKLGKFEVPTSDSFTSTNSTIKHPEYLCDVVTKPLPFSNITIPIFNNTAGPGLVECYDIDDKGKTDEMQLEIETTIAPLHQLKFKKAKLLCAPEGGVPGPFCGDHACNGDEDASSCPEDCVCAHDKCVEGGPLSSGCDGDPCTTAICAVDPFCCSLGWDNICVQEVDSICGETCPM
jgi:hypothetical protein